MTCAIDNDPGVGTAAMFNAKNVTDECQADLVCLVDAVASDGQMRFVYRMSLSNGLFQRNQRISRSVEVVGSQGYLSQDISLSSQFRSVAMLDGQTGSLR
jgi:hypothetical protein